MTCSLGVWIIGSLLWDETAPRVSWRNERLDISRAFRTVAPIRYGRRSSSRSNTYTMVFSEALSRCPEKLGRAVIVPCLRPVKSVRDLIEEAEHLWAAERDSSNGNRRISAGWGCLGLAVNRSVVERFHSLADAWRQRVTSEKDYAAPPCSSDEEKAIGDYGMLQIPWPRRPDGSPIDLDLILAAGTYPTFADGQYVSADGIAKAWITQPRCSEYFWKNREHGIETFQDEEIELLLREAGLSPKK